MSLFSLFSTNKQEKEGERTTIARPIEPNAQAVRPRKRKPINRMVAESAGTAPVDPVLPEKKRARRRLVGAVALVLAMIVGLPMVLDSEPKPLSDDLTIEIPAKDRISSNEPLVPNIKSGKGGSGGSAHPAPSTIPDLNQEVPEPPAVHGATTRLTAPFNKGGDTPTKNKISPEKLKSEKNNESGSIGSSSLAGIKMMNTADKKDDLSATKNTHITNADYKQEKFTVQVATSASAEKVNQVRIKLRDAGITSYTQKVAIGSSQRTRIRVRSVHSKHEAEKLRARLAILGLKGTVVPVAL
jgi:DedD protein